MRCNAVRHCLNAYIAGELSPAQRLQVSRHLAKCEACRATFHLELATVRRLEAEFHAFGRPSAAQLTCIWRRVRAQTHRTPSRYTDPRPAGALLTLTVVLVCAAFLFRGSAVVAAPLPPLPAVVRATATPLFTETPDLMNNPAVQPTASFTAVLAQAPSAAPAPIARKP
ncbi:MAG: zf-HC2 domain-containing protein [Anaerolineae bacterium]|nr:zf-HC2 domain-containing protein [Anaerolineae bacterium]MDW8300315.1 zf-HC2 domain-containing protein [Anaerolineae bacterium]